MENHQFKLILSSEEDVYRILDLTDTSLVGITEMFENGDERERSVRAEYTKEIKANKGLRAKITGYGIFVSFDDENTKWVPVPERGYLLAVLRQMAVFFKENVIDKEPELFEAYLIPGHKGTNRRSPVATIPSVSEEASSKGFWKRITEKNEFVVYLIVFLFFWGVILLDIFVFDCWLIDKIESFVLRILFIPSIL